MSTPYLTMENFEPVHFILHDNDDDDDDNEVSQHHLLTRIFTSCDTRWFNTSWIGILVYTCTLCLNYVIGYFLIYKSFGWETSNHPPVRIFGDIVTIAWFSVFIVCLPWHEWERWTCIRTKNGKGLARFGMWWLGTLITFFVFGYMGQHKLFQTSLASTSMNDDQKMVYVVTFCVIGLINIYWIAKLCVCHSCKCLCKPSTSRKIVFIRLFLLVSLLFIVSYLLCHNDKHCVYHLHHWWFGFVLVMLSSATLDNWVDYFLQGVFWTFLIESVFNYSVVIGSFFM